MPPADIDSKIQSLTSGTMSLEHVIPLLDDEAVLVRANAIDAISRLARNDDKLLHYLVIAATNPNNRAILMGTIRVCHIAIANLVRIGTQQAMSLCAQLVREYPSRERADLFWYLQSEGLSVAELDA